MKQIQRVMVLLLSLGLTACLWDSDEPIDKLGDTCRFHYTELHCDGNPAAGPDALLNLINLYAHWLTGIKLDGVSYSQETFWAQLPELPSLKSLAVKNSRIQKLNSASFPALQALELNYNSRLSQVSLAAWPDLRKLIVHGDDFTPIEIVADQSLTKLAYLDVRQTTLTVTQAQFPNLVTLAYYPDSHNNTLDVSAFSQLKNLVVAPETTQTVALIGLEPILKQLESLHLFNLPTISRLDLSPATQLKGLELVNLTKLTSLTLPQQVNLDRLAIKYTALEHIDLSMLKGANELLLAGRYNPNDGIPDIIPKVSGLEPLLAGIERLEIEATNLKTLHFPKQNRLASLVVASSPLLTQLDLSPLSHLRSLDIKGTIFSSVPLEILGLEQALSHLEALTLFNTSLPHLPVGQAKSLKSLSLQYNDNLNILDMSPLSQLEALTIWSENTLQLENLDKRLPQLQVLDLDYPGDTELDLSSAKALEQLAVISSPMLKVISLPLESRLEDISIVAGSGLETLDLSRQFNLRKLYLAGIEWSDLGAKAPLDVLGLEDITSGFESLSLNYTTLEHIALEQADRLVHLELNNNPELTQVSLPLESSLLRLDVNSNQLLKSVDLHNQSTLSVLSLTGHNSFPSIDVVGLEDIVSGLFSLQLSHSSIEDLPEALTKLRTLTLSHNPRLAEVSLAESSDLRLLSIAGHPDHAPLQIAGLQHAVAILQELNLSRTSVEHLSLEFVEQLERLTLSNNPALATLGLPNRSVLDGLSITENPLLQLVDLSHQRSLSQLNVIGCETGAYGTNSQVAVQLLGLSQLSHLTSLHLAHTNIGHLSLSGSSGLNELSLTNNPNLSTIALPDKASMSTLSISGSNALTSLNLTPLSSLRGLTVRDAEVMVAITGFEDVADSLHYLDLYNTGLRHLSLVESQSLWNVSISGNPLLTQLVLPASSQIHSLSIDSNNLLAGLSLPALAQLKNLIISSESRDSVGQPLTPIAISGLTQDFPELRYLSLNNTNVGELRLSQVTSLKDLILSDNPQLTSLQLPEQGKLLSLHFIPGPGPRELDLTPLAELARLDINAYSYYDTKPPIVVLGIERIINSLEGLKLSNTALTRLDLTHAAVVRDVVLSDNELLTNIVLPTRGNLNYLSISRNKGLQQVDISPLSSVTQLGLSGYYNADNDESTLLDVIGMAPFQPLLESLNLSYTRLPRLILEDALQLERLYTNSNPQLELISVAGLPLLGEVHVQDENLQSLAAMNTPALHRVWLDYFATPHVLLYNTPKLDKSELASQFPNASFVF